MHTLAYILIASFLIASGALVGIIALAVRKELIEKILLSLVSLSAGTLMGGAFFHLMPEAAEKLEITKLLYIVLFSFILFFFIEKIIHWHHHHTAECEIHTFGYINIVGSSIHNFIDGLIIAATFLVDVRLGITTSVAIVSHEIPQKIGDFCIFLYAGFEKRKAIIINILVALTIVIGGVLGYFLSQSISGLITYLLPFAAGGFLYISTSDLIPEIKKEKDLKKSLVSFVFFLIGIAIMYLAKFIE